MQTITINFEAGPQFNQDGIRRAMSYMLHELGFAREVSHRSQDTSYTGPDGHVEVLTHILTFELTGDLDALRQFIYGHSVMLGEDCIALDVNGDLELIGPLAEKWMPADPRYFVRF